MSEDAQPTGKVGSAIREGTALGRWVASLTPVQVQTCLLVILVLLLAGQVVWQSIQGDHSQRDRDAYMSRAYESESERARLWYDQQRDKDRQHCEMSDERQQRFFAEQSEKNRAVLSTLTAAVQEHSRLMRAKAGGE